MNREQEKEYLKRIEAGDVGAYHAFITAHSRMVYSLAHNLTPQEGPKVGQITFQDLAGDGHLALCEASQKYLENFGFSGPCKFTTFAYQRVHSAMVKRLRTDEMVEKTEWRARRVYGSQKLLDDMAHVLGRAPTYNEVVEAHGEKEADIAFYGQQHYVPDDQVAEEGEDIVELLEEVHNRIEYNSLPLSTRIVLRELSSGNGTLGEITTAWDIDREEVRDSLYDAYQRIN